MTFAMLWPAPSFMLPKSLRNAWIVFIFRLTSFPAAA